MKASLYPGCTLKTRARNLEASAIGCMAALGIQLQELPSWNCCGAVHSLSQDDLMRQIAPVRVLIRVLEQGNDKVVTLCAMCYNTLARTNLLMRNDMEKRKTINLFMDEERDYHGEVEVVHFLNLVRDEVGWARLRQKVKIPLRGLKIASYYGCLLQRPREIAIEPPGSFQLLKQLFEALGATVIDFPGADLCCGSYQILGHPEAAQHAVSAILTSASTRGAEAVVLSCPLCEFNLRKKQEILVQEERIPEVLPIFYFTQLVAISLGLNSETCLFDLNDRACIELLKRKNFPHPPYP